MTRAALAAALLAVAGCSHVPASHPVPDPNEGTWATLRDAHTREANLYDGLATRAFARAIWEAPAVRAARVERTAAWKSMTVQEREKAQATEDEAAAAFDEFTVSLFTPDPKDNDLSAPQSSWRIALVAGDGTESIEPKVTELRVDTLLRTLYPKVGDFDVVYRVRFARRAEATAGPFTLRLAGPRGRLEFPFAPDAPEQPVRP